VQSSSSVKQAVLLAHPTQEKNAVKDNHGQRTQDDTRTVQPMDTTSQNIHTQTMEPEVVRMPARNVSCRLG